MTEPKSIFILTAKENEDGSINMQTKAHGFSAFEIIGILQNKILELHSQISHPEKYEFKTTRIFTTEELAKYFERNKQEELNPKP